MDKKNFNPYHHTIHKNEFEIDHINAKYKCLHHKTFKGKY